MNYLKTFLLFYIYLIVCTNQLAASYGDEDYGVVVYDVKTRSQKELAWQDLPISRSNPNDPDAVDGRNPFYTNGLSKETVMGLTTEDGSDGRTVKNTRQFPHCTQGCILGIGTGGLIAPNVVLTAGHCVYDSEEGWFQNISFIPGKNEEDSSPFGEAKATHLISFKRWVETAHDFFDMALIILDQDIGYHSGWGSLAYRPLSYLQNKEIHLEGYAWVSDDHPVENGRNLLGMSYTLKDVQSELFTYIHDTRGGQSGSNLFQMIDQMAYVIGVHTRGEDMGDRQNKGVRISHRKFSVLKALLNFYPPQDFTIPEKTILQDQTNILNSHRNSSGGIKRKLSETDYSLPVVKKRNINYQKQKSSKGRRKQNTTSVKSENIVKTYKHPSNNLRVMIEHSMFNDEQYIIKGQYGQTNPFRFLTNGKKGTTLVFNSIDDAEREVFKRYPALND